MQQWLNVKSRSAKELYMLRKLAGEMGGDQPLRKCDADLFGKAMSFCKTPSNYMRYRSMVKAILKLAFRKKQIAELPDLDRRDVSKAPPRDWLTLPQWRALQAELPPHQRLMATFAIETGLRQANVLNLKWEKIDLARKHAWVDGYQMKNGHPISVPLSDNALQVLEEARLVMGAASERVASRLSGDMPSGYVFTYKGKPIAEIKTSFQKACVRAGVGQIVGGKYKGFTWHGLRHTWATWHVQNGTPLGALQHLGGWRTMTMVMNYAHHSAGHLAAFANANKTP